MKAIHNYTDDSPDLESGCAVSQRYRKMKAIHNQTGAGSFYARVVLYLKDTEK